MIKNFTTGKIYQDTAGLETAIKAMEFKDDGVFGEELPEMQMLPEGLINLLNEFSPSIKIDELNSGTFRKPYNTIHCENVAEGLVLFGCCAISPTKVTFYKHIPTDSENVFQIDVPVQEVLDECILPDKWEETNTYNIKQGEMFFFQPGMWHKIESDLIQVFYYNIKDVKQEKDE